MAIKKAAESKYKVDIKDVVSKIQSKNWQFYNDLEDSDKKGVQTYVVMGWLSRVCYPNQLLLLNGVNKYMFAFYKHQLLSIQLLTTCFNKTKAYKQWIPFNKKQGFNKTISLICEYYGYNEKQAKDALKLLTLSDIIEIAEEMGYESELIHGIKKEFTSTATKK